jgi:hypothetical protein
MYGAPKPEDRDMHDGRKIKLSTALVDGERVFDYVYDYGDNWCCVVVLEAIAPTVPGVAYPRLVEGATRGPPEDVGGPWGYGEFLEAKSKARAPQRTARMVRRRLPSAAVRYRRNQSSSRLARTPRKSTRRKTAKPAAG